MIGQQSCIGRRAQRALFPMFVMTLLVAPGVSAQSPTPPRVLLVGATLLDGTGVPPREGARIAIENGRFTCVAGPEGCPSQPGDREVRLTGMWITPGLIDTHVHLPFALAPSGLQRLQRLRFAMGITTVRDAGSRAMESLLVEQRGAEEDTRPTPRVVVASLVLPEDARRLGVPLTDTTSDLLVQRLVAQGVNAVKIKGPFERENWRGQIRAARAAGVPSFGHTWASVHEEFTRAAIAEGISGISHIMAIPLGSQPAGIVLTPPDSAKDFWPWEKRLWLSADSVRLDSIINAMVKARVWLEPTLVTEYHFGRALAPPLAVAYLRRPPSLRAWLRTLVQRQDAADQVPPPTYPATWRRQAAFIGTFIRRGGVVITGADDKSPGFDVHEEMRLIGVAAGDPMAGLLAATRHAAGALNRPDLGTIEVGKRADAVVYATNPLGTPNGTPWTSLSIRHVVKGGVVYDGDTLRAEFRAEYSAQERRLWRVRAVRGLLALAAVAFTSFGVLSRWRRRRAQRAHA